MFRYCEIRPVTLESRGEIKFLDRGRIIKTEWMGDISPMCGGYYAVRRLSRLRSEVSSHSHPRHLQFRSRLGQNRHLSESVIIGFIGEWGEGGSGRMNEWVKRGSRGEDWYCYYIAPLTRRKKTIRKDQKKNNWKQSLTRHTTVFLEPLKLRTQLSLSINVEFDFDSDLLLGLW